MNRRSFIIIAALLLWGNLGALEIPLTGPAAPFAPPHVPAAERALRVADFLLLEPGYARMRSLAAAWHSYVGGFASDEKQAERLEALANERAILSYLKDPKSYLAPAFRAEAERILKNFGNGALLAWRLRSLAGETILAHNEDRLASLDTSETRRSIGPRYFTIPISGVGFNFTLDAEWDITKLSTFPLTHANSEFLFVQTDGDLNIIAVSEANPLPDSAYRFISAGKFIAKPYSVQNGMRVLTTEAGGIRLILCYPFAGYAFYALRGSIVLALIVVLVLALRGIGAIRSATRDVLENRQGKWLGEHYEQSLSLNEKALDLSDRSVSLVAGIKDRDAELLVELGRRLGEISTGIEDQTRFLIEEAVSNLQTKPATTPVPASRAPVRLNEKRVQRPAILIDGSEPGSLQVSIELDLPLAEEKQLPPDAKAEYISSLKRRAQEKTTNREFVHDEKIDNFDYTPDAPLPLPEKAPLKLQDTPASGDLEYVQKFRYAGKTRVLPLTVRPVNNPELKMHEDLHKEELLVAHEEE